MYVAIRSGILVGRYTVLVPSSSTKSIYFCLFLLQALRVSMEEQRQRQEEEARRATAASGEETPTPQAAIPDSEEAMLQQALSMSTPQTPVFDFSAMTEEQQIEYAMRLSLQNLEAAEAEAGPDGDKDKDEKEERPGTASAMETDTQVPVQFAFGLLVFPPALQLCAEKQHEDTSLLQTCRCFGLAL